MERYYVQPENSLGQRALNGLSMIGVMGSTAANTDLVEGRIVFLCTEPKTIEPNASAWNALADALLASVHDLGKVPALKSVSPTGKSDGILLGLKARQRSNPFLNLAVSEQL